MKKINVAILFGGHSSEYSVSLLSATSVIENINQEKYEPILIGITNEGNFKLYTGPIENIENDTWNQEKYTKKITFSTNREDHGIIIQGKNEKRKIDIVFPVLHGRNGEDGRLQGLLELAAIPYVGCDSISSAICMDKYKAHELVRLAGIPVPNSYIFNKYTSKEDILTKISDLNYPIFVKPLKAGSSYGITKVTKKEMLSAAIDLAFKYDDTLIIEEGIDGFEVGCAILGNNELTIGEVDEIELQDGFFDFTEKYNLITSKIILPARLSDSERKKVQETALKIYRILGCSGFARVDMFYTKEGEIYFNEVNTIPGFTSHSRYPSMLKEIGFSFSDIIDKLIELGLNR